MTGIAQGRVRRLFRRFRRMLAWGGLLLLILAATVVGLASQLLPLLDRHPDAVARWLSERTGAPVSIDTVAASWSRAGPRLALGGLRLGQTPEVLDIDRASLQINIYSGLWPGMALTELRFDGPELELHRDGDGRWRLDGFGRSGQSAGSQFDHLDRLGAIEVVGARLRYRDALEGWEFSIPRIDARMQRQGRRLHFGASVRGEASARLRLAGTVSSSGRDGRLYLEGVGQDWAALAKGQAWHGLSVQEGRGDLRVWLDFADGRPSAIQLDSTLSPLVLAADEADASTSTVAALALSRFQLRWQRQREGGWHLTLPAWHMQVADAAAPERVISQAHVSRDPMGVLRLQVDHLDVAPLARLAAVAPPIPTAVRGWLDQAALHGRLDDVRLWLDPAGTHAYSAGVRELGWSAVARVPALDGVSGAIEGDDRAARLRIAAGTWNLQAPETLRAPFVPKVAGEVVAWRQADGLHVEVPALALHEDSYRIVLSGGVAIPEDDSGVVLDFRADVDDAPIVVAKRFWPINVMPSAAVSWLDSALVAGRVARGHALVRGNVRDWPFRGGEGRFEAVAELAGVDLEYRHDWLPGHDVSGEARFINTAMEVDLSGRIGDVQVARARGGIPDFGDPVLHLDVKGMGEGMALLNVLKNSPLRQRYGQYMEALRLGGRGTVSLALDIPLKAELGSPRVEGQVDIARMDLHDGLWGVDFDAASGRVRFSDRGFLADELAVGLGGALGALSIAVGDYTSRAEHVAEASLRGRFPVHVLTAPYEQSRWLGDWLAGESDWTVQLSVPAPGTGASAVPRLRIRSDLVGTSISLPAPLRKTAADRLPLDLRLGLPVADSDLDLRLGGLLHLTGRNAPGGGFDGVAVFGDAPDTLPPTQGLRIVGQVPVLDTGAWAGVVARPGNAGDALHVASVDLFAGELNLLGKPFRETRLGMVREPEHWRVTLDGPALQGQIGWPLSDLASKGISGRFARLYWPDNEPENPAGPPVPGISPASIPPLHLEVADARFAGAHLGSAWLETRPAQDGLRVERLDTQSDALNIKSQGDWWRSEAGERTELTADFTSPDAGAMLAALGFTRLLDGGAAHGQLRLAWPGAPEAFDWSHAQGQLALTLGKGRVLEVEPGAGRLFGLLSLTEIPRRLALDFSDFFKSGLAFNQMSGNFSIVAGDASTEDFRIDAPAAEIRVRGRTGLKARDYDQVMDVLPKAGSVLPAIGAIAAGPAGAAVGAVAQAVLRQPLRQMARTVYHVTGTWSEPKMQVLERDQVPPPP